MFAESYGPLLSAIEVAARELRAQFEASREKDLDVPAVVAAHAELDRAWAEYVETRGLFFEL